MPKKFCAMYNEIKQSKNKARARGLFKLVTGRKSFITENNYSYDEYIAAIQSQQA